MAHMRAASVPVRTGTHSSAWAAVVDSSGSMAISFAPFSRPVQMAFQAARQNEASAGLAPQATMVLALARSSTALCGEDRCTKQKTMPAMSWPTDSTVPPVFWIRRELAKPALKDGSGAMVPSGIMALLMMPVGVPFRMPFMLPAPPCHMLDAPP